MTAEARTAAVRPMHAWPGVVSRERTTPAAHPRFALIASGAAALTATGLYLVALKAPAPTGSIVLSWVAIGVSTGGLALYAGLSTRSLPLSGALLAGAALLGILWLLLSPGRSASFAAGWISAALLVPLVCRELLAPWAGRPGRGAGMALLTSAAVVTVCWIFLGVTSNRLALASPAASCVRFCPHNVLYLGSAPAGLTTVARDALYAAWSIAAVGIALYLAREFRISSSVSRRGTAPYLALAAAYALAITTCVLAGALAPSVHPPLAWVSLAAAISLPFVMLTGIVSERLFMSEALEDFVNALPDTDPGDLRALMAQVLHDPLMRIENSSAPTSDDFGTSDRLDPTAARVSQAVAAPNGDRPSIAARVRRDVALDQQRFIRAASTAASISRENHRLETDLSATTVELAASRKRLVDAANGERRRIERDIHDGIQQRMVGARVKLELADDALDGDPARGRRMLAEVGCDLDDALEEVRSLAQGVYPALLETHGLLEALRSVARRSPGLVTVRGDIGRYAPDTEAAVYFCCLETLQNVAKHAGRAAQATVHLWQEGSWLWFRTRDTGVGFAADVIQSGQGLVNMRDRLAAVGGAVTLSSRAGIGTTIEGSVPSLSPAETCTP